MHRKLTRRQRRSSLRVTRIVRYPVAQCCSLAFYLAAYLRVFVRPNLRIKFGRRRPMFGNLATRFLAQLFITRPARLKLELLQRYRRWQSLYYMHGADPYTA